MSMWLDFWFGLWEELTIGHYDELEPAGLIDWQVGGLLALENPHDVKSSTAIAVWEVVTIAHQPARLDIFAVGVHRRDGVTRCQPKSTHLLPSLRSRPPCGRLDRPPASATDQVDLPPSGIRSRRSDPRRSRLRLGLGETPPPSSRTYWATRC